jgi:HNH endonuclease
VTPEHRRAIWERDDGICGICHEPVAWADLDIDHIHPAVAGGSNQRDNLRAAHKACNRRKVGQDRRSPRDPDYQMPGRITLWLDPGTEALLEVLDRIVGGGRENLFRFGLHALADKYGVTPLPPLMSLAQQRNPRQGPRHRPKPRQVP